MVRIGGQPLGFGESRFLCVGGLERACGETRVTHMAPPQPVDECGIVAQIAGPLAAADISAYYISTFNFDHALVSAMGCGGGSWRDTEARRAGAGSRGSPDPALPPPIYRCLRTASAASSRSSSDGRRAWAYKA